MFHHPSIHSKNPVLLNGRNYGSLLLPNGRSNPGKTSWVGPVCMTSPRLYIVKSPFRLYQPTPLCKVRKHTYEGGLLNY